MHQSQAKCERPNTRESFAMHTQPRKPLIGITSRMEPAGPSAPIIRYRSAAAYADAVMSAGGAPLLLPIEPEAVNRYVEVLDGMIFTGSAYAFPSHWYADPTAASPYASSERELYFELKLIESCLRIDVPVLGICGGMQLLGGAMGARLTHNALTNVRNSLDHNRSSLADLPDPVHQVAIENGSLLRKCTGASSIEVNSMHLEAVVAAAPGVVVTGRSPDDVIEAIEIPELTFAVGVQWHPEHMFLSSPAQLEIFRALVNAASLRRSS